MRRKTHRDQIKAFITAVCAGRTFVITGDSKSWLRNIWHSERFLQVGRQVPKIHIVFDLRPVGNVSIVKEQEDVQRHLHFAAQTADENTRPQCREKECSQGEEPAS